MNETQNIQRNNGGSALSTGAEPTHEAPVYTPVVDIFETDQSITVLADMPGVEPENLTVDLRENVLTLVGRVKEPERQNESWILREHTVGTFLRQFTLSQVIDQAKIDARLVDGVLRLELPKVEKAKPRQISVKVS